MQEWKKPPVAKIYEALGAVADSRLTPTNQNSATVVSSSGDKKYLVEWGDNFEWINSNDNASFWQGYLGYPIIAVLLKHGKLQFNQKVAEALRGIPWKKLNTKNKNNYAKTIEDVLSDVRAKGGDADAIVNECSRIEGELAKLDLKRPSKRKTPPKSSSAEQPKLL